jgi:sec-independent protein translocase protein TatB
MFTDLSWSHMLLVLVVALVVVGPKDLPKLMRTLGQWTAKARDMADQFRRSFDDMARQSELDELRKELQELRDTRPFAKTEEELSQVLSGPVVSIDPKAAEATQAHAAADAPEAVADSVDHTEHAEQADPPEPAPSGHEPPAP